MAILNTLHQSIREAAAYLQPRLAAPPRIWGVLTSGLEELVDRLADVQVIPAAAVPHFPKATAEGHKGNLVSGRLNGVPVLLLQGRFHYYEGYEMAQVTFPTHVAVALGARQMMVTNVAGSVNAAFKPGQVMLITDHINAMGASPLRGFSTLHPTQQFTDMTDAYAKAYFPVVRGVAKRQRIALQEGVYIAVNGPNYETPAEIRAFRAWGADAVGMSTVPEVTVANYYKMKVCGLSLLANMAADLHPGGMSHAEVLATMAQAKKIMIPLVAGVIEELGALPLEPEMHT